MKDNELTRAENARYDKVLGGITRRPGYESLSGIAGAGTPINGLNSYSRKSGDFKLLAAADTDIYYENGPAWASITSAMPDETKVDFENMMDKTFVVGYSATTDTYLQTTSIFNATASTTSDVYQAPRGKYITKFQEKLYIANCSVDGKKYPNRVYVSSAPKGIITSVNGDYKGIYWQIQVDSVRYLKPGMVIDIYGQNSNKKKVDSLTIIGVDKAQNKISFAPTNITISDIDDIYLEDTYGQRNIFWNTDYPTAQSADFIEIPVENNEIPVITGTFVHNNRYWIFTEHSRWKWDGANLVKVSSTIGTTSHWSIKEVRNWMVFCNKTGIWTISDANGQEQLISRGIQNYVDAVNQVNWYDAVAVSTGDLYKLYVGPLSDIDGRTTSTSTSSTSTSSTSSSTSSTSTSSTSTSSTSTSSTTITTSTSSTSRSTSTTSASTSSTSSSSTSQSTSTSTTTVVTGTEGYLFVYDFSMNVWSTDTTDRRITASVNHIMHGYEKMYFGDSTGHVFRDGTGLTDATRPVQFLVETKRFHQDKPEETKTYRRAYIYTQNGHYGVASYSIDGGEWQVIGQLSKNVTGIELGDVKGRDIAFRVAQNNGGESVVFIGVTVVWLRGELYA
jgi:hypothetical protein